MKATNMSVPGVSPAWNPGMLLEEVLLWPILCNVSVIRRLRAMELTVFQIMRIVRKAGMRQFVGRDDKEVTEKKDVRHVSYGVLGSLAVPDRFKPVGDGWVDQGTGYLRVTDHGVKMLSKRRIAEVRQRASRWAELRQEASQAQAKSSRLQFVNGARTLVRTVKMRMVWGSPRPIGAHAPRRLQAVTVTGYNIRPDVWDAPPGILQEAWDRIVREKQGLIKPLRPLFNADGTPVLGPDGKQLFGRKGDGVKVWQDAKPGPVLHLRWSGDIAVTPDGVLHDPEKAPEDAIVVTPRDINRAAYFWARRLFKHHIAALNRYDRTRIVADVADLIVGLPTVGTKKGGGAWVAENREGVFALRPSGWIEDFRRGRELKPEDRGFILALRILHPNMSQARSIVTEGRTLAKYLADARVKLVLQNPDGTDKLDDQGRTVYKMVRVHDMPLVETPSGVLTVHPKVDAWFKRFDTRKKRAAKGWAGEYSAMPLGSMTTTLECDPRSFRSTARNSDPTKMAEMEEDRAKLRLAKLNPAESGVSFEDWVFFRRAYLSGRIIGQRSDVLRLRRIAKQLGIIKNA